MVLYHRGAAIWASSSRRGNTFVAQACILKSDGEPISLGDLGQFASRSCAFAFAVRSATAFVDGKPLPREPFHAIYGEHEEPELADPSLREIDS